jgi:nitroreductase
MKAILERRSIRKYTDQKITDEQIQILLKAAFAAPSAGNKQSWHFIVVDDRETLNRLADASPNASMLKGASHAIVVCGDTSLELYPGYFAQDCSAATENILVSATELGLGSVWLGVYPKMDRVEKVANIMNTPEGIVPFCMISLGCPAESREPSNRYDDNKVHHNKW